MYQIYLQRIQEISDFLAKAPHPDQAVEFLSLNFSPVDQVSVAYRGIIETDGRITCANIKGFSKHVIISSTNFKLSDARPISVAARSQKMVWASYETVSDEFPDFVHFDSYTSWKEMVSLPVGLSRIYSFSFASGLRNLDGIETYIESVGSILRVYESALDFKNELSSKSFVESSEVQPLSDRQARILELLKLGHTNKQIADEIAYSESLVRHETMIIYKKMRVEGRHELRESS